jgi:hypothetical protein
MLLEVLKLQQDWTASNTPAMQRRGDLVRSGIPAEVREIVASLESQVDIADLAVEGRDGTGLKSEIPWVRIHSKSRSPSATTGWYLVYLFSAAGERVYLSLNQGTTSWTNGEFKARSSAELEANVAYAREMLGPIRGDGDPSIHDIRLESRRAQLARGYERGSVVAAEYPADAIPPDDVLRDDLRTMTIWLAAIYRNDQQAVERPAEIQLVPVLRLGNSQGNRAGFRHDVEAKLAIEQHAVATVSAYLIDLGYTVSDVGANQSFDIDARRGSERLHVEVKGTTTAGQQVILTKNEVALHREIYPNNALGIVRGIEVDTQFDPPRATGGELVWISPWEIHDDALETIAFWYASGL